MAQVFIGEKINILVDPCNSNPCCSRVNYIVFFCYLITLITLLHLADWLSFYRIPLPFPSPPHFRIKMTMVAYIYMIKFSSTVV